MPTLDERIGLALSTNDNWNLALAPEAEDPDRQTILFEYPSVLTGAKAYVRSAVKIEMGARSDNEPAEQRVEREDIFARAARHREIYFNRSWMDYSTLRRGKLRLVPLPGQVKEWRKDYQAMSEEMFFGEVPKFEEVLRVVEDFEKKFR